MGVHFRDVKDVLGILRDVYTYIAITKKNDNLGDRIMTRIERILKDNEESENWKKSQKIKENIWQEELMKNSTKKFR